MVRALGLTEPGAGSDVKEIRTRAGREGDDYVLNGQKVYISNGQLCEIMVCALKTDPNAGAKGVSLIAVETDQPGFIRGRNFEKIGLIAEHGHRSDERNAGRVGSTSICDCWR